MKIPLLRDKTGKIPIEVWLPLLITAALVALCVALLVWKG